MTDDNNEILEGGYLEDDGSYRYKYLTTIDDEAIPLMEVMGNEIFYNEFGDNPEAVYQYCLENKVTWREVLKHKDNPNAIY